LIFSKDAIKDKNDNKKLIFSQPPHREILQLSRPRQPPGKIARLRDLGEDVHISIPAENLWIYKNKKIYRFHSICKETLDTDEKTLSL
jgi:hypothetical protein